MLQRPKARPKWVWVHRAQGHIRPKTPCFSCSGQHNEAMLRHVVCTGAALFVTVGAAIRFLALLAIAVACGVSTALAAGAPLAVYYSFDTAPPSDLFTEIQSELGRILAPSGLRAAWRATDAPRDPAEAFGGIVVFRFHGQCSLEGAENGGETDPANKRLAETELIERHILPFGAVDCDKVRAFIAPVLKTMPPQEKTALLGRALARVSAHEIYHMLTGSDTHAKEGIFRSSHSRRDLTATKFSFAAQEIDWLRTWVEKQAPRERAVKTARNQTASIPVSGSGDAAFTE